MCALQQWYVIYSHSSGYFQFFCALYSPYRVTALRAFNRQRFSQNLCDEWLYLVNHREPLGNFQSALGVRTGIVTHMPLDLFSPSGVVYRMPWTFADPSAQHDHKLACLCLNTVVGFSVELSALRLILIRHRGQPHATVWEGLRFNVRGGSIQRVLSFSFSVCEFLSMMY